MKSTLIKLNRPFILLLLIPFLTPTALYEFVPGIDKVEDVWILFSVILITAIYLFKGKMSKVVLAVAVYTLVVLLSTVVHNGDYWYYFVNYGKVAALCMLFELCMPRYVKELISVLTFLLGLEVLINFYLIIRYPAGLYIDVYTNNWLFGYDNVHFVYIFPLLCVSMIYAEYKGFPFPIRCAMIALFSASIYITWSATSVVAVTVWILLWLFTEITGYTKLLTVPRMIAAHGTVFFGFVIVRVQEFFAFFIEEVLGKSLTFTGRTAVWDLALEFVSKNFLLGLGYIYPTYLKESRLLGGASHCHNHFLQILFQSGIIGMASFLAVLLVLKKPLKKTRDSKYTAIMLDTVFCFLIVGQAEAITDMTTFFAIITLLYHAADIEKALAPGSGRMKTKIVTGQTKMSEGL